MMHDIDSQTPQYHNMILRLVEDHRGVYISLLIYAINQLSIYQQ